MPIGNARAEAEGHRANARGPVIPTGKGATARGERTPSAPSARLREPSCFF
jgi:hypothetical protein